MFLANISHQQSIKQLAAIKTIILTKCYNNLSTVAMSVTSSLLIIIFLSTLCFKHCLTGLLGAGSKDTIILMLFRGAVKIKKSGIRDCVVIGNIWADPPHAY